MMKNFSQIVDSNPKGMRQLTDLEQKHNLIIPKVIKASILNDNFSSDDIQYAFDNYVLSEEITADLYYEMII